METLVHAAPVTERLVAEFHRAEGRPKTVRLFRAGDPGSPAARFRRGDLADAAPVVPGWTTTLPVEDAFTA